MLPEVWLILFMQHLCEAMMGCLTRQISCRLSVPVARHHDRDAPLSAYMALPVSQFVLIDVPLGARLERLSDEIFEIVVPRLELFGIWVQPQIKCIVR